MRQETSDRTGITIARTIWRWGGWLVGVALTVGARQLLLNSAGPEMAGVILEAVAAALLAAGSGIVLLWLGYLVWVTRARQQFRARANLIDATIDALESDHPERENLEYEGPPTRTASKTKSLLHQTIHVLDRLKVEHPPFAYDVNRWLIFLSRLLAASRMGDLNRAKNIWLEMEAERQDN